MKKKAKKVWVEWSYGVNRFGWDYKMGYRTKVLGFDGRFFKKTCLHGNAKEN